MAYFLSSINIFISGVLSGKESGMQIDILLGIVLMLMVPISIFDRKRENRGTIATIGACIIHLTFCVMLSCLLSPWWMAVYVGEILLGFATVFLLIKFSKNH